MVLVHDPIRFGRSFTLPKIGVQNKYLLASLSNSIVTDYWPGLSSFVPSSFAKLILFIAVNSSSLSGSGFVRLGGFMKKMLACAIYGYT